MLPGWTEEDLGQIERLWISPQSPWPHTDSGESRQGWEAPWIPPYGHREADFLATAVGHARGRWLLTLQVGERLEIRNARTFLRYIRHVTASPEAASHDSDLFLLPTAGVTSARPQHLVRLVNPDAMAPVAYVHRDMVKAWLETHPHATAPSLASVHLAPVRAESVPVPQGTGGDWPAFMRDLSLGRRDLLTGGLNPDASRLGWDAHPLPLPLGLDAAAESAFWRGAMEAADQAWRSVLEAELRSCAPVVVRARLGLARLAEARGAFDEGLERYAEICRLVPGEPESIARLCALAFRMGEPWARRVSALAVPLRAWRGVARALDRVLPPPAQREGLAAVAPGPLRDLLLARAALHTGDPALALRTLLSSELAQAATEEARDAWTYARYMAELASGRAEAARSLVLGWAGLSQAGRTALLVAERIVGQHMQVPDLPSEEDTWVRQWLFLVAEDLTEVGLDAQAAQLRSMVSRAGDFEDLARLFGTRLATPI